jgi:hypothetical protein
MIYAGDPEPAFTLQFDGFVWDEDESVITDSGYLIDPVYDFTPGTRDVIPYATADNYLFTPDSGILYVNPFGSGTKHIKPSLRCVEELIPPVGDFTHIAYFEYENDNPTDVYIPIGPDNIVSSPVGGTFEAADQPEIFKSGGGNWEAMFDGQKLTWMVASFRHNGQKSSVASNASSNSSKCHKSAVADGTIGEDEGKLADFTAYPNPADNILYVTLSQEPSSRVVLVYDTQGRLHPARSTWSMENGLEINMAGLNPGLYLVRVEVDGHSEAFRVIKH